MKYKPGTFVLVPNLNQLSGKPSEMQVIYMWLCTYADDDGRCFPSRRTLAKESGCNIKTVDKYIQQLVDDGFIEKENRGIEGSKQKLSNFYTMLLLEGGSTENGSTLVPKTEVGGSTKNGAVTISNNNYNNITILEEEDKPLQEVKNSLPEELGKTPHQRLLKLYSLLFKKITGVSYNINFGKDLALLKKLTSSESEVTLAVLMIIFFNWYGMDGTSEREHKAVVDSGFNIGWFSSQIGKYKMYMTNVAKISDVESEQMKFIRDYMGGKA